MKPSILATFAALSTVGGAAAHAASFDCSKARSGPERAICDEPAVSAQDEEMAALYRNLMDELSPKGQAALRSSQREWVAKSRRPCGQGISTKDCLEGWYDRRIRELRALRMGPFLFAPVSDSAWPTIERPHNEGTDLANALIDQIAHRCMDDDRFNPSIDVEVTLATSNLLGLVIKCDMFPEGAAHGLYERTAVNVLLRPARKVTAETLFSPGAEWRDYFARRVADTLKERLGSALNPDAPVESEMLEPANWRLLPGALTISFPLYSVTSFAYGMPEVTIPWADLRPYLHPNFPITEIE
ncbi:MAG: DUF3298 domain-containing protein [Magnetospirillum sp.]|nr:DUF3298 domain-containing protein [Magnetospirillum sp.]